LYLTAVLTRSGAKQVKCVWVKQPIIVPWASVRECPLRRVAQAELACADTANVSARRVSLAPALAVAALAVAAASAVWAWATFSYWEAGPVLGTIAATAAMSASALFVRRRRVLPAVVVGLLVAAANLALVLAITLARWEA
jgi:hypothetical protein